MPRGTDRYDTARLQGRLWTPLQIPNLDMWCDPTGPQEAGTNIAALLNKSAATNDRMRNTTGANQPTLVQTGPNGMAVASFDGSNDQLSANSAAFSYNSSNGYTVYAIAENNGSAAFRAVFGVTAGGGVLEVRLNSDHTVSVLSNNVANLITSTTVSITSAFNIVGASVKLNSSSVSVNGTEESNATDPAFTGGFEAIGFAGAAGDRFTGRIGEFIICTTMLAAWDRRKVEGYLAWRWGLVSVLPGTHIYKNAPPLL